MMAQIIAEQRRRWECILIKREPPLRSTSPPSYRVQIPSSKGLLLIYRRHEQMDPRASFTMSYKSAFTTTRLLE